MRIYGLAKMNNKILQITAPYHPAGNRLTKRTLREIKMFLACYPNFSGEWEHCLEATMNHHNRAYNESLGCRSFYKLCNMLPKLRVVENFVSEVNEIEKLKSEQQIKFIKEKLDIILIAKLNHLRHLHSDDLILSRTEASADRKFVLKEPYNM